MAKRCHHARFVKEPSECVGALGAGEVGVEELDRDVAIELGVAREIDHACRAAAELAHQPVARARLHTSDVTCRDRLAGRRRRATGEHAESLDARAHVGIVDVATEHGFVVTERSLVIASPACMLGQQVVSTERVRVIDDEQLEMDDRGIELAALLVALDEVATKRRAGRRRHLGNAQQLLHPLDRE